MMNTNIVPMIFRTANVLEGNNVANLPNVEIKPAERGNEDQ